MPEETKETKAQKLAAARKKLKEYQKRGIGAETTNTPTKSKSTIETSIANNTDVASTTTIPTPLSNVLNSSLTSSVSSHFSTELDSELNLNDNGSISTLETSGKESTTLSPSLLPASPIVSVAFENDAASTCPETQPPTTTFSSTAVNYFTVLPTNQSFEQITSASYGDLHATSTEEGQQNLKAMQVLITDKAQLSSELSKYRAISREKDLELEELRTQYNSTAQRLNEVQQRFVSQQQTTEQYRNTNAELQHKLAQVSANIEDQVAHLDELRKQLQNARAHCTGLEEQLKEKCNELELSQIRVRQLSDETSITKDDRVETLTQTKFMYEQQIRDLQAMVQQLSQDKEQANIQYQTYVQHLNVEVAQLNERNAELTEESVKLQARERELVEHVSGLEHEIQKNIALQDQLRERERQDKEKSTVTQSTTEIPQLSVLEEQISELQFERHEFQLKIKSQEDRLEHLTREMQQKTQELELAHDRLDHLNAEQPDTTKLLATMESDKVAASRAISQNVELKKQLDELEVRFVQLTNDKAELMNKLDAEEYANREMRNSFSAMEQRLHNTDERFKFKDEEMIRLSHETMELKRKNTLLEHQLSQFIHNELQPNANENSSNDAKYEHSHEHGHEHEKKNTEHCHDEDRPPAQHAHGHHDHDHHNHNHDHNESHDHNNHDHTNNDHTDCEHDHETKSKTIHDAHKCVEELPSCPNTFAKANQSASKDKKDISIVAAHMPNAEAVEKLQTRFTQLMSQVADLTEEKQRLEHLVLQLQGETETIGEYIALYQTQRRMLKQREYEKAAQMQLLQEEREQMRQKITILNNLVASLDVELPHSLQEHVHVVSEEHTINDSTTILTATEASEQQFNNAVLTEKLNTTETQQILTKIQDILTDIKENTKEVPTVHSVDHLNCCLGKFEVV